MPKETFVLEKTTEQELKELSNELFIVDTKVKELQRAREKFDGTLENVAYKGLNDEPQPLRVDELLNAITPEEEVVQLQNKAIGIIQKMRTLDQNVQMDCFLDYGF